MKLYILFTGCCAQEAQAHSVWSSRDLAEDQVKQLEDNGDTSEKFIEMFFLTERQGLLRKIVMDKVFSYAETMFRYLVAERRMSGAVDMTLSCVAIFATLLIFQKIYHAIKGGDKFDDLGDDEKFRIVVISIATFAACAICVSVFSISLVTFCNPEAAAIKMMMNK